MTHRMRALLALTGSLSASLLTSPAWAIAIEYDGNWFMSAGAGRSFYLMNGDNFINACEGLPPDHYYKNEIHDGSFVNLTGGYSWVRYSSMFPAFMIGLNYTYGFNGKVSGYINEYGLTDFKNYSYSYDFSRQSVMGIVKLDVFSLSGFMPYVMAGGGVSFNRASSYEELPLMGVTPRVSPGYGTGYHTSGAYVFGAGIDFAARDDIWVSLGYQYGYYGTVETSNGDDTQTVSNKNYSGNHIANKLKANSVTLDFTYLINYV